MTSLYVLNNTEELICKVLFKPSLSSIFPINNPDKLIITDYNKDSTLLDQSNNKITSRFKCVSIDNNNKLKGFNDYLLSRKKAACINVTSTITIYLIPVSTNNFEFFDCLTLSTIQKSKPIVSNNTSTSFLDSLLNKAESTKQLRDLKPHLLDNKKQERIEQVKELTKRLAHQFKLFSDDPNFQEFHLEPMDQENRYVVHEVVIDFPDLLATAVGELDERHIIVYRKGHTPKDLEDLPIDTRNATIIKPKAMKSAVNKDQAKILSDLPESLSSSITNNLVKLNPIKRDRRTTETILEQIKKRKQTNE